MSPTRPSSSRQLPERWFAESANRDVVKLDIPADAQRERRFEIYVRLLVSNSAQHSGATHALRVQVDGALEWSRSTATDIGTSDSLDWRQRRTVPAGRPLRLSAVCALQGARRVSLQISAEED